MSSNRVERFDGRESITPYILASLIPCQISILVGIFQGYPAIIVDQLEKSNSSIVINADQATWIGSLGLICQPVGAILAGYIADKVGRKRTMHVLLLVTTILWLLMSFSDDIIMIYSNQILLGLFIGMSPCVTVYINEISKNTYRGILISLIEPCIAAGIFAVYALGGRFNWQTIASIISVYDLIVFFSLFSVPESYVWYVAIGNKNKAIESLTWFGKNEEDIENEVRILETKMRTVVWRNSNNYFYAIRNRRLRARFLMFISSSVLQSMLGVVAINTHVVDFYDNLKTPFDGNVLSIISATISFVGALIAIFAIHKFSRKTVICISGLGMVIFIDISAISYSTRQSTITLIVVFAYMFFSRIGIFLVPSIVISESFPTKARASLIAIRNVVMFIGFFISSAFYPIFKKIFGVEGVLLYLAIVPFINVIYVIVFFPETKDRTITDMEEDELQSSLTTNN